MKKGSWQRYLAVALLAMLIAGGGLWWGYAHLTGLVTGMLQRTFGSKLTVGKVEAHWNRLVLENVRFTGKGSEPFPDRLRIETMSVTPRLSSLLSGTLQIGLLRLERPTLLLEIAPNGQVVNPLPPLRHPPGENKGGTGKPLALAVGAVEIVDGTVHLLDRHSARKKVPGISHPRAGYHLLTFSGIAFRSGRFAYPLQGGDMPVHLALKAPTNGSLALDGTISPSPVTVRLNLALRRWDITRFRPYYLKPDDMNVTGGTLDADASITITGKRLSAPGSVRLRNLAVDHSGARGFFLGLPVQGTLAILKNRRDEIEVPFTLAGDLGNPSFKVRQSLKEQLATGFADKIGLPTASSMGKGIFGAGASGLKGLFGGGE